MDRVHIAKKRKKNCTTRPLLPVITQARVPGGLLLVSVQTRFTLSPVDIAVDTVNRLPAAVCLIFKP